MDEVISDVLMGALAKRTGFSRKILGDLESSLREQPSPHPSEFSVPLPKRVVTYAESGDRYHEISLRRLLHTHQARDAAESMYRAISIGMQSIFGVEGGFQPCYSSDIFVNSLLLDGRVVRTLEGSTEGIAMLAKWATYDCEGSELRRRTTPLLVIPGQEGDEGVQAWEQRHVRYEEERHLNLFGLIPLPLLRSFRTVPKEEYLGESTSVASEPLPTP